MSAEDKGSSPPADVSTASASGTTTKTKNPLGYYMKEILVGIVVSKEYTEYASNVVAKKLHEILPDRIRTIILTETEEEDGEGEGGTWPTTNLLVVCCSKPNFPSTKTSNYIQEQQQQAASSGSASEDRRILVLTDLDLDRNLSDVQLWYQVLEIGGLGHLLPRRAAIVSLPSKHQSHSLSIRGGGSSGSGGNEIIDRRDQIEINGTILLKPILERSNDPTINEIRIYYPRSQGGGCKTIQFVVEEHKDNKTEGDNDSSKATSKFSQPKYTSKFESEIRHVRKKVDKDITTCWIYEEVAGNEQDDDDEDNDEEDYYDDHGIKRKRERKRDRIKQFVQNLTKSSSIDEYENDESKKSGATAAATTAGHHGDDDEVSYESDLSRLDRKIYVVTTASLPWMTGTAVNPLLRAAYLKRRGYTDVTLVIPWLERQIDRDEVYGTKHDNFTSQENQEIHVRNWLKDSAHMVEEADPNTGIKIMWYPSRYYAALGSIFPTVDICKQIPDEDADYCILEEPEHLNWFRSREGDEIWTEKFSHVVGIIHTNYRAYASSSAAIAAPIISGLSTLMVRAYCDKVVKLSATLQTYAPEKEVVCNVHGVRSVFLEEGKRRGKALLERSEDKEERHVAIDETGKGEEKPVAYFIGKLLWEKGLDRLLRLQYFYKDITGDFFPIDIVGDGPDRAKIESSFTGENVKMVKKILAASNMEIGTSDEDGDSRGGGGGGGGGFSLGAVTEHIGNVLDIPKAMQVELGHVPGQFHGRQDHAEFCSHYKVIVNPSITEVLCTTTAEALAMGKFAIIPKHPSNGFFYQFPNCLPYENKVEFVKNLAYALENEPEPLTEDISYAFTWEGATERLIKSAAITMKEGRARAKARKEKQDFHIAKIYNKLGSGAQGEAIRMLLQGGPDPSDKPRPWAKFLGRASPSKKTSSSDAASSSGGGDGDKDDSGEKDNDKVNQEENNE